MACSLACGVIKGANLATEAPDATVVHMTKSVVYDCVTVLDVETVVRDPVISTSAHCWIRAGQLVILCSVHLLHNCH